MSTKLAEPRDTIRARQHDGLEAAPVVVMRDEGRIALATLSIIARFVWR